ncbi:MAG: hypothetical protein CMH52_03455 [Myxococcales bacterium]|nr:hypothetical protein [Myxococcales bacterium]
MNRLNLFALFCLVACSQGRNASTSGPDAADATGDETARTCQPQATTRCVDGHPTWIDSCGVIGDRKVSCGDQDVCEGGTCVCATTGAGIRGCYGNDIYRFNDCGEPAYLIEACGDRQVCRDGRCTSADCTPGPEELCDAIDNDCDGVVDEGQPCTNGQLCADGRCVNSGELCTPCIDDDSCSDGYRCLGYRSYPDIGRVCVLGGCRTDSDCPDGTACDDNGVCWLNWSRVCRDGQAWSVDSCGRAIGIAEDCGPGGRCNEGRCIGTGRLCDACEGDRDCDAEHLCRGYSNYDHLPMVCVPKSNCNEDSAVTCPDGLQCSQSGVCWLTWTPLCGDDGDVWQHDTCQRRVVRANECRDTAMCDEGRCLGTGVLCGECIDDGDCARGFRCRGYSNYPDIPKVCVQESDCAVNPAAPCPDGFQCSETGVCWLSWTTGCGPDPQDIANIDNCGRAVSISSRCDDDQVCQDGLCVPAEIEGAGDAGVNEPAQDGGLDPQPGADQGP